MLFEPSLTAKNPIDKETIVGKDTPRIDGPLKVSGTARYAYERKFEGKPAAYGFIVGAGVPKGRIEKIDDADAKAAPGVIAIVTYENSGKLGKGKFNTADLLAGPNVEHYHQAVAFVVAETFEQARYAGSLLKISYNVAPGAFDLAKAKADNRGETSKLDGTTPGDSHFGDFDAAFANAAVKVDETYVVPDQSHAMMEPFATIANWDGDKLTVYTASQMVNWWREDLAKTLGIKEDDIHLVSNFIGGGFGAKLFLRADAVLAALGARAANRPVKVAMTRPLMFNNSTHRPATIQHIRIGADEKGAIQAIAHESWSGNLKDGRPEAAVAQTRLLYAGANRQTATRLAVLDLTEGNAMRAPGEAPGMMALEIAMDELAERVKVDPVELRIRNNVDFDPEHPERKFTQRPLVECLQKGAEAFGWSKRNATPRSTREGDLLIGIGMASAFRNHALVPSAARVRLLKDGSAVVETDMTDIGTGSYTIIAQTAAEMLGLPLDRVAVRLGDSDFPISCGSGGQFGAANSTSGVYAACVQLRMQIATALGLDDNELTLEDGKVKSRGGEFPIEQAAARGELVASDGMQYSEDYTKKYQVSTFGAHFVEVGVDQHTAEIRIRRMLAVCASGRILNPKTARSQVIGAMTMGIGAALMEELKVDTKRGFFVNHNLADYEVPVHADVPHQDVIFIDEPDPLASVMKAKGVGELGLCGAAAAVSNAVYNATGVRVRDYPVTLDKLLNEMPVST